MEKCPVCLYESENITVKKASASLDVKCPKCGEYIVENHSGGILNQINDKEESDKLIRTKISYWIRQKYENNNKKVILYDSKKFLILDEITKYLYLPKPAEQAELFIRWLGENIESPEEKISINFEELSSIIGANGFDGVFYIAEILKEKGIIIGEFEFGGDQIIGLTFNGWKAYEEIKRKGINTKRAFMAMKFGSEKINNAYNAMQKAVEQTGFILKKLDEIPKTGLIDNILREEIFNSKFVIDDLTENNYGVYFEGGYAEGLGKNVIYTCEEDYFKSEDEDKKIHFDTNHIKTILWNQNELQKLIDELKATIRLMFPDEAIHEDKNEKE